MHTVRYFQELIRTNKMGRAIGITSVCSAHPYVLRAAMEQAVEDDAPILIESTVNQVNQFGGYTGMTPADFRGFVVAVAGRVGFPVERVIIGGDHLGPYPWRAEAADAAMAKACALVADSVKAGYAKLHLDASMPLGGDSPDPLTGLEPRVIAEREAQLAEAAEAAHRALGTTGAAEPPVYVIGTDVPTPGGIVAQDEGVYVTSVEDLTLTIEGCEEAFARRGLQEAWSRVIAAVVQPGVEFGDQTVHDYDRLRAASLCAAARTHARIALEGHSTDYQTATSLRHLVEDGVAILKVGPALTFSMREALLRLELVERDLPGLVDADRSDLCAALDRAMRNDPRHWKSYYPRRLREQRFARRYSLSDRCRYYWTVPEVQTAVARLVANLRRVPPPYGLLSQHLPNHLLRIRGGGLACEPEALVCECIRDVLRDYSMAAGLSRRPGTPVRPNARSEDSRADAPKEKVQ